MTTRQEIIQFITELYNSLPFTSLVIVVSILVATILLGRYWVKNISN